LNQQKGRIVYKLKLPKALKIGGNCDEERKFGSKINPRIPGWESGCH
jgi:hypothetical protein